MIQKVLQEKFDKFTTADQLKRAGMYPYFRPIEENNDVDVVINGKRLLMFGSNSYLGLTGHPKVKEAAKHAIEQYGSSCSGSRFLNGTSRLHLQLEEKLADFVGKEAALLFTTGFQTNLGTVSALTGRQGLIVLDEADHASIIEGSRLSFSKVLKFAHNDMSELKDILRSQPAEQLKMIVVDGVFSMEGDICPLPEIAALSEKYHALLMVDDAHSFGVLGREGRGTADHFGLTDKVDIIMSTFSKSLASVGGFIAASKDLVNYLMHHSRPLIFSASIPPSAAAAAMAALEVMQEEPERLEMLWENTAYLTKAIREIGFDTSHSETPIIPIYIRDNMLTFKFTQRLYEEGIFVNPVVSPAVPGNASMIRISVMATHKRWQLDEAIGAFERIANELQVFAYKR